MEDKSGKDVSSNKHVSPLSVGKVMGLIYAVLGLMFGAIVSCISLIGSAAAADLAGDAPFGVLFGVGAIIAVPLLYPIKGFVMGIIVSVIYNLAAGWIGGIELVME